MSRVQTFQFFGPPFVRHFIKTQNSLLFPTLIITQKFNVPYRRRRSAQQPRQPTTTRQRMRMATAASYTQLRNGTNCVEFYFFSRYCSWFIDHNMNAWITIYFRYSTFHFIFIIVGYGVSLISLVIMKIYSRVSKSYQTGSLDHWIIGSLDQLGSFRNSDPTGSLRFAVIRKQTSSLPSRVILIS